MLRIKENVDLKELEKYGFKFNDEKGFKFYSYMDKDFLAVVPIENKIIYLFFSAINKVNSFSKLDIIYDLIINGLLEKVEDK